MAAIYKIVIYALAAVGLVYVLLLGVVTFGPGAGCAISEIKQAVSPGSRREAKLIVQHCREEADPMLVLSLTSAVDDKQSHAVVIGLATTTDVDITWLSDAALQVSHPVSFRIAQRPTALDGVAVTFVAKPAPVSLRPAARVHSA